MWIFKLSEEEEAGQKQCKSCGAPIIWAITTNGARCPLNANFETFERKTFKLDSGVEVTIIKVQEKASHFTTCPQKNQWRKKS